MSPITVFETNAGQTRHLRHDYVFGREVVVANVLGIYTNGANPYTFSYTVSGVSNKFLIVVLMTDRTSDPTGITYGGVAMTKFSSLALSTYKESFWYLINPASGTNDIVITHANPAEIAAIVVDFSGVHQITPLGGASTAQTTATSQTVTVSGADTDLIFDVIATHSLSGGFIANASQTDLVGTINSTNKSIATSTKRATSGGSTVMAWSWPTSRANGEIGVAIKPA